MFEKLKKYITSESQEILNEFSVGIIICNNLFEVQFINRTFIELCNFYNISIKNESEIKSIFDIDFFNEENIKSDISLLHNGLPFESEISRDDFNKKGLIKLIIKATPLFENDLFVGVIFIVEDLKVAIESTTEYIKRNADLQKVIEESSDFFIVIDKEFYINQYSKNIPNALKSFIDEFEKPTFIDIVYDDDIKVINYYLNYVKLEKKSYRFLIKLKNKIEYACRIIPLINKHSEVNNYYLFFDVNDNKIGIRRFSDSNKVFDFDIFKKLGFEFIVYDEEFNIVQLSKNLTNNIVFPEETDSNKVYDKFKFLTKEFLQNVEEKLKDELTFETTIKLPTQYDKQKIIKLKILLNEKSFRLLVLEDITTYYQNDKNLNKKVYALETTIVNSPQITIGLKTTGEIIFFNNSFLDSLGYSKKDLISKSFYNLITESYLRKNIFELSAFTQKNSDEIELPLVNSKGKEILFSAVFKPIKTTEGDLIFIACYLFDVQKLKSKEIQLNYYKKIVHNSYDAIAIVEKSRFSEVNQSFLKLFNYDLDSDIIGRDLLDIIWEGDIIRVTEFLRYIELKKQQPSRIDFIAKKSNRTLFHTEMSASLFDFNSHSILILSFRDITAKIETNREIWESEKKYRTLAENIEDCLFTYEKVGFGLKPTFCTPSIKKIIGYSEKDFLSDSKFFFRISFPEDFKIVRPKLLEILKSKSKKSGELDFRVVNIEGNVVWVKVKLSIQRTLSGNIQKIYGVLSDVTLLKKNYEDISKSLEELKKLNETKDKFISIISHDLRTPFTSILGFTDLLLYDDSLTESERKQYIKFVRESAQSMLSLVNSILDWTRLQTGRIRFEPAKINVTEVIKNVLNSLSGAAIKKSINIINLIHDDIYLIVDKNLISQAISNLISNAIKFTPVEGKIEISAKLNSTNNYYIFSIKDSGIGIKPEDISKLFLIESKFTTEGTAGEKGTGLGLSFVKEIIEKHNGKIWVESQYGKGSNFQFSLPVASANILLLESDNAYKILLTKMIKNFKSDFNIITETSGLEAISKVIQYDPALIILNHNLEDMIGIEFIKKLFELNLRRKIQIIVIGNIDKAFISDYRELGIEFILNKPLNVNSFNNAIEKSLLKNFKQTKV